MKSRLFSWFVVMLIGFGTFGIIATSYLPNPTGGRSEPVADSFILVCFFGGMFLFLLGLVVLIGYLWRKQLHKNIFPTDHWPVFRQASLIAIMLTSLLILQSFRVLSWWDGILLGLAVLLVEVSFLTRSPQ